MAGVGMEEPALIAGLGNPGSKYFETRHNAGFLVVDGLVRRWGVRWEASAKFRAEVARGRHAGRQVTLCRPQTYMNLSGQAVGALAGYYRIPPEQVMVVADDADLPLGTLRMRGEGGTGGHHGLESISTALGTKVYGRQRFGIGVGPRPAGERDLVGHVLGRFSDAERDLLERTLVRAMEQLECWLAEGLQAAMNRWNGTESNAET